MKRTHLNALSAGLIAIAVAACSQGAPTPATSAAAPAAAPVATPAESAHADELAMEQKNLANFDDLDFNVFSNRKWDQLSHSHAKDILVHWPDGHTTTGIDVHIADLEKMFVYAPDTRIKVHPIRIAQGNLTAVSGVMEGTFTQPMPLGDGKFIQPTGKAFKLPMATIGRWENGVMQEEWLYWDNQTYMTQLGLAK